MTTKPFYITTPLYYVNAKPHIGHAYTNVLCDTFARFHRFLGEETFFLTGTDEHGTKIARAAAAEGKEPKTYVDGMAPAFEDLWEALGIEYDRFIRTTDPDHKQIVQNILRELEQKGDIYLGQYRGWYCTPCESFWTNLQLVASKCPDCKREVQELSEDNYFFKLKNYQDWLIQYIDKENPDFVRPAIRKNEILGFLREPLEDLCITRPRARLAWGIDYPASKEHVVYVWFDALVNYVSGIGYSLDSKKFSTYWPADLQVVGKDILRQHAVYWPIMLKAIGVEMPKTVLAHGWWTLEGAKVSKSRGNAVDPTELIRRYGSDAFRYFLLHEAALGADGAFSERLLADRYTSDLANDLGNLWFRLASMLEKYFEGKFPEWDFASFNRGEAEQLFAQVIQAMEQYDPRSALTYIFDAISRLNRYIEEKKPWVLAKDSNQKEKLAEVLGTLGEWTARAAVLLLPFLPKTAEHILSRFRLPIQWVVKDEKEFGRPFLRKGMPVEKGGALFPRLDEEKASS